MKWLRNATWSNRGDFRECFGWWQLRSGHNYVWIHRKKVAKKIQVQRLWKEAHRPWPRFAEWPVLNFTFKRRFICTTKGACRIRVKLFCDFGFWIFRIAEGDILSIDQVTRPVMYVLEYYGSKCEFCCEYHLEWGVKFASKIVVNVYFNNKQKQAKDCVRKDSVERFKTRQRRK